MRCPSRDLHICGFGVAAHFDSLLPSQLPRNHSCTLAIIAAWQGLTKGLFYVPSNSTIETPLVRPPGAWPSNFWIVIL